MSTQLPRLEARISAQEHLTVILHARIEELSQDMDASFDKLAKYQIDMEQKLDARFDGIESHMATKEDVATLGSRIDKIEAQIASMEGRMFDAFQQLIAMIDTRLPPKQ
jgi:uncharacterized coiled-coil protein SlyX